MKKYQVGNMKVFRIQMPGSKLLVHHVDIANGKIVRLFSLARQAKPFYDWVEREAQAMDDSEATLNDILFNRDKTFIHKLIMNSFEAKGPNLPQLFDAAGRSYTHNKAVFYFFAWMIRDAPQQRLYPLVTDMINICKNAANTHNLKRIDADVDSLAKLFVAYRKDVESFSWNNIREVIASRLEGSRRSLRGHMIENYARTCVATAVQTYYTSHKNYGVYQKASIEPKQIKIGKDTVDITVNLASYKNNGKDINHIYIPVKSRETEGGGHSYLFSRDIMTAITNIKHKYPKSYIGVIVVANNWNYADLKSISNKINFLFQFDMNPDYFKGFNKSAQKQLNKCIRRILDDKV